MQLSSGIKLGYMMLDLHLVTVNGSSCASPQCNAEISLFFSLMHSPLVTYCVINFKAMTKFVFLH